MALNQKVAGPSTPTPAPPPPAAFPSRLPASPQDTRAILYPCTPSFGCQSPAYLLVCLCLDSPLCPVLSHFRVVVIFR